MSELPNIKDLIQIRVRTINNEFTLPVTDSLEVLKGIYKNLSKKDTWVQRDVNNAPDKGDVNPDFVKGTFKMLLEKMGYDIKSLGDLRIGNNKSAGKDTKVIYVNFEGVDKNHIQEREIKKQQTQIRIKKRKAKEKAKRKKK